MPPLPRLLALALLAGAPALLAAPAHSQLWGEAGEKWSATGRLPDFSFAGYHRGERPIPELPRKTNVRDFGAVGDGTTHQVGSSRNSGCTGACGSTQAALRSTCADAPTSPRHAPSIVVDPSDIPPGGLPPARWRFPQ